MEQTMINKLNMKINFKKSKKFVCSRSKYEENTFTTGNQEIEQVEEFKYY